MGKGDAPALRMRLDRGRLVPDSAYDQERLATYQNGAVIYVTMWQKRNEKLLRKYWAILHRAVADCPTPWENAEEASDAIKMALGITDFGHSVNGQRFLRPGSISFGSMDEAAFRDFYEKAMAVLARVTGVDPETLHAESADVGDDEHEPASAPSPTRDSAVESMGNPAVPSGDHASRSDGAVVPLTDPVAAPLSADEAEQPAHAAAEQTGADGIEAADGPSAPSAPVVLPKDRAELIDKLLRLAGDAKAIPDTDERQRAIAEAADGWLGSLGDHAKPLVKAVYETARKVAKGELKADAARKYLEGLPS